MRQQLLAVLALAAAGLVATGPAVAATKHAKAAAHAPAAAKTGDASPAPDASPSSDASAPPAADAAPPGDKAASAASEPAPGGDEGAVTDMRCIVAAGALLQSDDEQVRSLGRASLFYYMGRLQGRGDVANLDARVIAEADKMTEDDFRAQTKTCSGMFTGAAQALQELSNAFAKHFPAPGGAAPKK